MELVLHGLLFRRKGFGQGPVRQDVTAHADHRQGSPGMSQEIEVGVCSLHVQDLVYQLPEINVADPLPCRQFQGLGPRPEVIDFVKSFVSPDQEGRGICVDRGIQIGLVAASSRYTLKLAPMVGR